MLVKGENAGGSNVIVLVWKSKDPSLARLLFHLEIEPVEQQSYAWPAKILTANHIQRAGVHVLVHVERATLLSLQL